MKKRNFITVVLFVVATGLILTTSYSFKKTPQKYLGLQLYSLRDSIMKNVPRTIAKVGKMGFKFVEPAGYDNGKFYGMEPAAFKALCNANGLKVISSHTGQALPSAANWKKTMEWWDACIKAHAAAGVKFIVQPFMGDGAYRSLDTLKRYCNYFSEIGEKCNAKGIRFGYHNHDKEFSTKLEGKTVYDFMLANMDPKKVMFEMDLYWVVVGGAKPVEYFNKYPGRFELWHIKDETEIGASGMMDFAAIWAGAAKSGMKYGIVEVERYNFDEFTSCQKSIDFLNAAPYVKMPKQK
jgi:sugar phosphate isomerase/epimerase